MASCRTSSTSSTARSSIRPSGKKANEALMKGNIGQLMKQAQQMQENMRRMQESLATLEVEGQSGAGMVKVHMSCKYEVKRVTIDPSLVGDDREMLEDLVAAAFNDASRRVEATIAEKMSGMTAGLGLSPGFKLPFLANASPFPPPRGFPPSW